MGTTCEKICEFTVIICLHHGSALCPNLFVLIIDKLIAHIQEKIPWSMLFVDDTILVDESKDGVNTKLEKDLNLIEMTSSGFVQKDMQSCQSPMVYFPLLAPS